MGAGEVSQGGSAASSMLSLVNTMLGTGLLGMPWAIAQCGLAMGLAVLGLAAVIGVFTLCMLSAVQVRHPGASFKVLMARSNLPQWLHGVPDVAVFFMCVFGGQASYYIVIGDAAHTACGYFMGASPSRHVWIALAALCVVPLALRRKLDELRCANRVSLAATALLAAGIATRALQSETLGGSSARAHDAKLGQHSGHLSFGSFSKALPVFIFGFTCHQQLPALVLELKQRSFRRLAAVAGGAVLIAAGVYAAVGAAGYWAFGPRVAADVLLELEGASDGAIAASALAIALTASVPLWSHAARESAATLLIGRPVVELAPSTLTGLTALVGVPPFFLALRLEDLDDALGLVGGTGCALVTMILPALLYLRAGRDVSGGTCTNLAALAVLTLGITIIAHTLASSVLR